MTRTDPRDARHGWLVLLLLIPLGLLPSRALAHAVGQPTPFHLSPGDYFILPVTGGTFPSVATVQVQFTPVAGGSALNQTAEDVVPNTQVGVRVPAGATGQYDVAVLISGTPSDASTPPDGRIWVRQRTLQFVAKPPAYLPGQPSASSVDFKDANFGDVDNDGFLDIFQSNSQSGSGVDRLDINQRGRMPGSEDCATTPDAPDFCNQTTTHYENSVTGIPAPERTYDADMVDLDLDGDVDLVRIDTQTSTPVRIFLNDGSGHFVDRTITRAGIGPALMPPLADIVSVLNNNNVSEVDSGDVDGDGRPDLLLCNWQGDPHRSVLLLNRLASTGTFVVANASPCGGAGEDAFCQAQATTNRGCAFGKFDGDDLVDIILPTIESADNDVVLINTGNNASGVPQFTVHSDWVKGPAPGFGAAEAVMAGNVKVADLDGDGDDDVAVASPYEANKGRILWNDAGTRLVELDTSRYPRGNRAYKIDFGDLDRDGDIDVVFADWSGLEAVLVNRGGRNANMKFEELGPAGLYDSGSFPTSQELSMHFGDYDLDGDLDLLTGGFAEVRVWDSTLFDEPGEDRDWVFVQDRTRSMVRGAPGCSPPGPACRDFLEPSKNVLKTFLGQRRPGDASGLATIEYTGSDPTNPNAADDANKALLVAAVGTLTTAQLQTEAENIMLGGCSGHCTAIGQGLVVGRDAAVATDPSREKVVVLLTDGEQNQSPHPDTVIPTYPSHVRIYTVALGTETDDRMLSALATNGGKFYFAGRSADYAAVQDKLRDIDEDLEAHSTGKQQLHPLKRLLLWPVVRESFRKAPLLQPVMRKLSGETPAHMDFFVVDPADSQVRFTLSWRRASQGNRLTLLDPRGRTYPVPGDKSVRERRGDKSHVIEVLDPLSGVWTVLQQVNPDTGPAKLTALSSTGLRLSGKPQFPLFYVGEPLRLTAEIAAGPNAPAGAEAHARFVSPSKQEQLVTGRRSGDRGFEFTLPNAAEPGSYQVELVVLGPPQRPFARTWQSAVHVAEPKPDEPDLRTVSVSIDRVELPADGAATAKVTARVKRRDGGPLTGGVVSFAPTLGTMTGPVQDNGDGSYTQTLTAGKRAGKGLVGARVGLFRLISSAAYTLKPGTVDPEKSAFDVLVGPLRLCTNQQGRFAVQLIPADGFQNPFFGATVTIDKASGPSLRWDGAVRETTPGVYARYFWGPPLAGHFEFKAGVNGATLATTTVLDVFTPDSAEGKLMACVAIPGPPGGGITRLPWWLWLLILLLILILLYLWWRSRSTPGTP